MSGSTRTLCFAKSIHTCNDTSNLLYRRDQQRVDERPDSSVFGLEERKLAHFAAVDFLAVHGVGVLGDDRGFHAVDDVRDTLDGQAVRDNPNALDNSVVEGNRDNLVDLDNRVDVAVDILVGDPDNQVAIADFVDGVVDIQGSFHLATLAVVGRVAGDSVDGEHHTADLDNRQAAADTTCLHPADSNYHSFILTDFRHSETDQYVVNQCLYTPSGICVDSTETLRRIDDRQMSGKTKIHFVVKSIHT